jgi:major vault protein
VYDVEAFKEELARSGGMQLKKKGKGDGKGDGEGGEGTTTDETATARTTGIYEGLDPERLATGQQFIIRGTDVHFYIPPNGIEVVASRSRDKEVYVQSAITLEQLQYCILQDENGEKRYLRGPDVVFPKPTEKFLEHKNVEGNGAKKFRAIELNETSGIYVKVIKSCETDGGMIQYQEGEELFITGEQQRIYYPRPEHAIIKYGDTNRHFAVALPAGEGRYVLNRIGGDVRTEMGPKMFLPNPIYDVVVKRVLSPREANLIFPGNSAVAEYNREFCGDEDRMEGGVGYKSLPDRIMYSAETPRMMRGITSPGENLFSMAIDSMRDEVGDAVIGDQIERKGQYAPLRSITLDSKFDGVVSFDVWNGYAVMVVDRIGGRRIVEGPNRVHLEYDETPEILVFSQGTPKNHDNLTESVFLRTRNNAVSDVVTVETGDLCKAEIRISMRVNFEGEGDDRFRWFSVDNYVKLLCERVRSILMNRVKRLKVMEFYADPSEVVRDVILGEKLGDEHREGLFFEEIGMRVVEVEVLSVSLEDRSLEKRLENAASDALEKSLDTSAKQRQRDYEEQVSVLHKEIMNIKHGLTKDVLAQGAEQEKLKDVEKKEAAMRRQEIEEANAAVKAVVLEATLREKKAVNEVTLDLDRARLEMDKEEMEAEAAKIKGIMGAVQPEFIAALTAIGDNDRIAQLAAAVGHWRSLAIRVRKSFLWRSLGAWG